MAAGLERRLARAEAEAERITALRDAGRERDEAARALDGIAEAIRAGLIRAGLDPADAACLNRLAAEPDPPAPPPPMAEEAPLAWLKARLARYAARPRDDPPDLADASMAELYGFYCLAAKDSS